MATSRKRHNNNTAKRTIKVSAKNHKLLNLFKIENEYRSLDEAIGALLHKIAVSEAPGPSNDEDKIST